MNQRLDKYLKNKYTSLTQGFIEKNIRKKNILINNSKTTSNYIVKKHDELKILNFHQDLYKNKIIFKKIIKIPQETKKIFDQSILYQDKNFIIINKWSSISTQGGSKIKLSLDDIIKQISSNYKLVHRLDKETSGLLIIAKNREYAQLFTSLFRIRKIHKTYLAITYGKVNNSIKTMKDNLIYYENKKKIIQKAISNLKILKSNEYCSFLELNPITGRKHQLRKQLLNIGNPIIGDDKYFLNNTKRIKTKCLMLHAYKIKFMIKNVRYNFKAKYNDIFEQFLKNNI